MAYITQSDIENAVGGEAELKRLTRSNPVDTNKVSSAIEYAESRVNEFAQGSPGYPWATVPDQAKQAALALAIYQLHVLSWPASQIPATVKEKHAEALSSLKTLSEGDTSWVEGEDPAKQNLSRVSVHLPGDTPREDTPRRASYGKLRNIF